jgi:hypothetical protein
MNFADLFGAVVRGVLDNDSPVPAWAAVVDAVTDAGHTPPRQLRQIDISLEIDDTTRQTARVLAGEPPPPDLSFYYFGLFDGADDRGGETAGFYIAGGRHAFDPGSGIHDLTYLPDARFLHSRMLRQIKEAAPALGHDRNVFDYGLMLGAAGILAKFSARALRLDGAVIVGFDGGDYAQVA